MKKDVISKLLIIFVSIIILTGFISAEDGCTIRQDNCLEGEYRVMGLSAQTNAHGQVWNASAYGYLEYDYVLCCDFGAGDTDCTGTNKIIGLSSSTNAHAEILDQDDYEVDVCYDGLSCINTPSSCDTSHPIEMFSLSNWTNAHIGGISDYPDYRICCNKIECREGEVNFCSDYYEEECEYDDLACNVAEVSVKSNNPDITCEEDYICSCGWDINENTCGPAWEPVPPQGYCGDLVINEGEECDKSDLGTGTCANVLGIPESTGTLSCTDTCTFDIIQCTGGIEGGECGDLEVNNFPFETCDGGIGTKTCVDFNLLDGLLACHSLEHANNCTFDTTACVSESHPSKIGKCTYNEDTDDNCDDGFLTYEWEAIWAWSQENIDLGLTPPPPCETEEGYVEDGGACYYDPNGAEAKCVDGYDTVPCPAQIELPFFGSYSVIIIIALIALVYVFLNSKKGKKIFKKKK